MNAIIWKSVFATVGLACLSACVVAPVDDGPYRHDPYYHREPYYQEELRIIVPPAPPPRIEYRGPPPVVGYIWLEGQWRWNGSRHDWVPGRWTQPPGRVVVPVPRPDHDRDRYREPDRRNHDHRDDDRWRQRPVPPSPPPPQVLPKGERHERPHQSISPPAPRDNREHESYVERLRPRLPTPAQLEGDRRDDGREERQRR